MTTLLGTHEAKCQTRILAPEIKQLIVSLTDSLAACHGDVKKLELLRDQVAQLNNTVQSFQALVQQHIVDSTQQQQQLLRLTESYNNQVQQGNKLSEINTEQGMLIKKLSKEKKWSVVLGAGYGATFPSFKTGPTVSLTIGKNIFSF